jgi:hypothetical protein
MKLNSDLYKIKNMKTTVKILMTIGLVGTMLSCKSSFNATETMQVEENRNAIYQEIIANPVQLTNFISEAQKSEEAKKILMKAHMEQMESGNMKMMMDKNPEMMQKMQSKMLAKMMESEKGRKMLMDEIHNNEMMKMEMKAKMMQMMNENPEMMEEMMQKMMDKNPEMMKKMKGKMK